MQLQDARCIVTGATSGIGLAVTQRLLDKGARVVAAARRIDGTALPQDHPNLLPFACDVSQQKDVDALFDFAEGHMEGVDLFFANAGFAYYETLTKPDWEASEAIFHTNVISVIYSLETLLTRRRQQPFFFLANASAMAYIPMPNYARYGATKAAVHHFSETARMQLQPGQTLSVVYPIATRTAFFQRANADAVPWPTQTPEETADRIIMGIENDQERIYPSRLFRLGLILFRFLPFTKSLYIRLQERLGSSSP